MTKENLFDLTDIKEALDNIFSSDAESLLAALDAESLLPTPPSGEYAPVIEITMIHDNAVIPTKGSEEAACSDLSCVEDFTITHGETKVINTGIKIQFIDPNYKLHIYSRSGLAAKNGIFVLNAPGVIDSDYRGELKVILQNSGPTKTFNAGDRIAQFSVEKVIPYSIKLSEVERKSARGSGGLGSTGINLMYTPYISPDPVVIETAEGTLGAQ